jgi:hypothetical protein
MTSPEVRELRDALTRVLASGDREIGRAMALLPVQDLERLARLAEQELGGTR